MPALEQNRSMRPCSSSVRLTSPRRSASRVTSTPSIDRSEATTVAPSAWNRATSAQPMPPAAPVTTATLSASLIASHSRKSTQDGTQHRQAALVEFRCGQDRQYRSVHPTVHILQYLRPAPLRRTVQ